jgi:hypothetical protein
MNVYTNSLIIKRQSVFIINMVKKLHNLYGISNFAMEGLKNFSRKGKKHFLLEKIKINIKPFGKK